VAKESGLSIYSAIAIGAAIALAIGWLIVSFRTPGRARSIVEWASVLALYLLLLAWMASRARGFVEWASERQRLLHWLLVGSFGFFCFLFGAGFLVCGVLLVREVLGKKGADSDATH